ncbi:uncharacterized protein LOC114720975 isoform X2 [Neltuma alba]|uniref:uncharacterized protein LOC114720975 isoform X2 n=1 Tax=Neltuma alba TaxID=207710 RepID=UPI0010A3B95B|nr:uncharacterized protein LOC114720975 isoform X2 [Prosopis alba]
MDFGGPSKPKNGDSRSQTSTKKPCAIPMLNEVMSATRGATDAFSGVSRHVNNSLRKFGAKKVEVGIGCGFGFGHGFGVGLGVKPGVLQQIQTNIIIAMTKMMIKLGIGPKLPFGQGALPSSLQSSVGMINAVSNLSSKGNMMNLARKALDQTSQGPTGSQPMQIGSVSENVPFKGKAVDATYGSRTEKVLNEFLQNPLVKGEGDANEEAATRLQSENDILKMVLRHQKIIEELVEENEKLRQILLEELKVPSDKLSASSSVRTKLPCIDCIECRRKQRKK